MSGQTQEATRDDVIEQISTAFKGVRLGDGITIHQARELDDCTGPDAFAAARGKDTETRWSDVSDDKIRRLEDVLNFLDDEGWVFYIPAYMIWVLRHMDDESDDHRGLADSTIYNFTNSGAEARSVLLNSDQRRAVRGFLQYLALHSQDWLKEAKEALRLYSLEFCSRQGDRL